MLRRLNPPSPLGPTTPHLAASTFMLYTLTFRVFLLSVTTSASITALEAFKKILPASDLHPRRVRRHLRHLKLALRLRHYVVACCLVIFAERGAESAWNLAQKPLGGSRSVTALLPYVVWLACRAGDAPAVPCIVLHAPFGFCALL